MRKFILILLWTVIILAPNHAMSNSDQGNDRTEIVRAVVRDMLSFLPPDTNRICVVDINLSGRKPFERKLLDLANLDKRISVDRSVCLDHLVKPKNTETIMYVNDLSDSFGDMPRPSDRKEQIVYDRELANLKEGNFLAGAFFTQCEAGMHSRIYAFKPGKHGLAQLRYSAPFPLMHCGKMEQH